MRVTLVTGTDTGVGKTIVTAALAAGLVARGTPVGVVKPAQTGVVGDEPGDAAQVHRLCGVPTWEGVRLEHALAPVAAVRLAGGVLPGLASQVELVTSRPVDHVLVEGAGGVLVPLGHGFGLLEIGTSLAAGGVEVDVVVVARATLGTLNHSALTVRCVRDHGLTVRGLVIGSWPSEPGLAEQQNARDLADFTQAPVLGRIPQDVGRLPRGDFLAAAPHWLTP